VNPRAAAGMIAELQLGTGVLQQGLGDEDAEAQTLAPLDPAGDVWLADLVDHLWRIAGAVVMDGDLNPVLVPAQAHDDSLRGELRRVLQDVAETVLDFRAEEGGRRS